MLVYTIQEIFVCEHYPDGTLNECNLRYVFWILIRVYCSKGNCRKGCMSLRDLQNAGFLYERCLLSGNSQLYGHLRMV